MRAIVSGPGGSYASWSEPPPEPAVFERPFRRQHPHYGARAAHDTSVVHPQPSGPDCAPDACLKLWFDGCSSAPAAIRSFWSRSARALVETGCGVAAPGRGRCEPGLSCRCRDTVQAVIQDHDSTIPGAPGQRGGSCGVGSAARVRVRASRGRGLARHRSRCRDLGGVLRIRPDQPDRGDSLGSDLSFYARPDSGSQLREPPRASAEVAAPRSDRRCATPERHHPERLDRAGGPPRSSTTRRQRRGAKAVHYGRRAGFDRTAGAPSQFADALDALDKVLEWLPRLFRTTSEPRHPQRPTCATPAGTRVLRRNDGAQAPPAADHPKHPIAHLAPAGPSRSTSPRLCLREGDLLTLLKRFNGARPKALGAALRIGRELDDSDSKETFCEASDRSAGTRDEMPRRSH